ncbi:hypothetical protein L2E82_10384 [Cichorium intybus]|uniref:Uncharacterized protein n=1 Tax=Cichorium intybus TaxID=13427 RepID=A0ACB9GB24_CICIN|nr:hypothetical protein L2E82_10384 [Cichorium intybus]
MTATLIIKPLACAPFLSIHAPPVLLFYASSFRLWTSFLRGGSGILCSPIHNHDFLRRHSPSSSQFSSLPLVGSGTMRYGAVRCRLGGFNIDDANFSYKIDQFTLEEEPKTNDNKFRTIIQLPNEVPDEDDEVTIVGGPAIMAALM